MPDLSHLWQRFVLTATLFVGLFIGVVSTVFGYDNRTAVSLHLSVLHIDNIPLWSVAVVPVVITLVASTIYHWMDGLHHFTEHMRHRRLVHELEAEVKSLRAHLDHVLEMPAHGAEGKQRPRAATLPAAGEGFADLGPSDPDDLSELVGSETPALEAPVAATTTVKANKGHSKNAAKRRARIQRAALLRLESPGEGAMAKPESVAEPAKASAAGDGGSVMGTDGEPRGLAEERTARPAAKARGPRVKATTTRGRK